MASRRVLGPTLQGGKDREAPPFGIGGRPGRLQLLTSHSHLLVLEAVWRTLCGLRLRESRAKWLLHSPGSPTTRLIRTPFCNVAHCVSASHQSTKQLLMGLFGNTQTDDTSSSMANQTSTVQDQVNLVGEGTVFEGTVRAESDVRASGRIIGTLDVEGKIMVAEEGSVEGEIDATNAEIAGQVHGEIRIEERLVLKSTARVDGMIETDRLVVEDGAQFTGECEMGTPVSESVGASGEEGRQNGEARPEPSEANEAESSEEIAEV